MAMPRKNDALHELHGTKPHDRTTDLSHVPSGRPRFLKDIDKPLRKTFKRIVKLLENRRVVTEGDADLIRLYAFQFERHERNAALLREEGEIITVSWVDKNGVERQSKKANPRLKVVENAEKNMAAVLVQLGLTQLVKDRAKPTANPSLKVVPGSIADVMPWLLDPKIPEPIFVPPTPISETDMEAIQLEEKPQDESSTLD